MISFKVGVQKINSGYTTGGGGGGVDLDLTKPERLVFIFFFASLPFKRVILTGEQLFSSSSTHVQEVCWSVSLDDIKLPLFIWVFQRGAWNRIDKLEVIRLITGWQVGCLQVTPMDTINITADAIRCTFTYSLQVDRDRQASTSVSLSNHGGNRSNPQLSVELLNKYNAIACHLIYDALDVYNKISNTYSFTNADRYTYVDLITGRWPLLSFLCTGHTLAETTPMNQIEALFQRFYDLAVATVKLREYGQSLGLRARVSKGSNEYKALVLTEMFTIMLRTMLYTEEATEQWSNPHWFPEPSRLTAYDCEDGSALIMDWVYVFTQKRTQFTNQHLRDLAGFCSNYTSFLVIGQSEGKQHVFVILLDQRWVDDRLHSSVISRLPATSLYPAILLESTAYVEGVWSRCFYDPVSTEQELDFIMTMAGLSRDDGPYKQLERVCHDVLPLSVIKYTEAYGNVSVLITNNHRGVTSSSSSSSMVQLVCGSGNHLGVEINRLMTYDANVRFIVIVNPETTSLLSGIAAMLPTVWIKPSQSALQPIWEPSDSRVLFWYDIAEDSYQKMQDLVNSVLQAACAMASEYLSNTTCSYRISPSIPVTDSHSLRRLCIVHA